MSEFGCDNVPYGHVVFLFTLNILISLFVWFIVAYACYQIYQNELKRNIKIISLVTVISLLIHSTSDTACVIGFYICPSERLDNDIFVSSVAISSPAMSLSIIMCQVLFTVRFIDAFDDSLLKVSNRLKHTLYTFSCIEILVCIIYLIC